MRVDETPAGDASGWECPRAEQNRLRPIDVFEVTGNVRPVVPAGGSPLPGAFGSGGVSGQWTHEGMSIPEPLEQLVLNTLLVARPSRGITEISDWEPVAHPVPDITLDG